MQQCGEQYEKRDGEGQDELRGRALVSVRRYALRTAMLVGIYEMGFAFSTLSHLERAFY